MQKELLASCKWLHTKFTITFAFHFLFCRCQRCRCFPFLDVSFLCCLSWSNLTNSGWHSSLEGTGRVSCGQSNLASCMFCFSPWQWGHSKGGDWQVLWWCWSEYFWLNDFPHSEQVWTMSPCLVLLCHSKSAAPLMLTLQMEQTCFPSMLTSTEAGGELKHWSKSGSIYSRSNRNWVNKSSFSHKSGSVPNWSPSGLKM